MSEEHRELKKNVTRVAAGPRDVPRFAPAKALLACLFAATLLWHAQAANPGSFAEPVGNFATTAFVRADNLPDGCTVVSDPAAEAGEAIQVAFLQAGALRPVLHVRGLALAGRGIIRVPVRGKDLNDVANGLKLRATLTNRDTGRTYTAWGAVYGVRARENEYRVLPVHFDVGETPAPYDIAIVPVWPAQTGDRQPAVWLGGAEVTARGEGAPYLSGLRPSRFIYAPGMAVTVTATVVNPTAVDFQGTLAATEHLGVEREICAATVAISVAAGATEPFDLSWEATLPEAGREVHFSLLDADGRELDRDERSLGIAKNGSLLMFPQHDFVSGHRYIMGGGNLSGRTSAYSRGRTDVFGWYWGDLAETVPSEDPFPNMEMYGWSDLRGMRNRIAAMQATGSHVVSYILGAATAEPGYALFQKRPGWFLYDGSGEGASYNMETLARRARRNEFEFMLEGNNMFFSATLDPTRPEVRQHLAEQLIHMAREMGWEGVRFDIWDLTVKPGQFRLDGTEIAPTWEEADRLSAESLRVVKEMVNAELPDFSWGYNYGSPEENRNLPLHFAEKCRGGGWILDEVAISYGARSSPYHHWEAYCRRMIEWGDHVRQLGGVYDPWIFGRLYTGKPDQVEVDWLHATVFRLLAGGRAYMDLYRNDSALVGNLPYLAFRFSDVFSGWNLRLLPEDQATIHVAAPDTLWWKGSVFANRCPEDKEQRIVHLVNSPVASRVSDNRDSDVRPAVSGVAVRCAALPDGRLPEKAFLLTAEPLTPAEEPKVQALPLPLARETGGVTVTVPAVLYLKTVVFQY